MIVADSCFGYSAELENDILMRRDGGDVTISLTNAAAKYDISRIEIHSGQVTSNDVAFFNAGFR